MTPGANFWVELRFKSNSRKIVKMIVIHFNQFRTTLFNQSLVSDLAFPLGSYHEGLRMKNFVINTITEVQNAIK